MSQKIDRKNTQPDAFIMALWFASLLIGILLGGQQSAQAQMVNEPWGFQQQNRASIAALMRQTEEGDGAGVVAAPGSYDSLVCGSDGASSAKGNAICIIMNNSDGAIEIGQDSQGDQEATSTENTAIEGMSEVLDGIADEIETN